VVEQTAPLSVEDKEYWDVLYRTGRTPWELHAFAPPLKTFLDSPYAVPKGRVAVLGSGTGQDALLFARYGFEVVAVDFSPTAVAATQKLFQDAGVLNRTAWVMERNIFDLHDCAEQFDYVLENTCFCAIHPSRRNQYAFVARDLLKPNGKVIALFWTLDRKGSGPPYPVNSNEIFDCFKQSFSFDIVHIPPDSVPERSGKELFVLMSLKNSAG
jgi:SAM-dependent methyltransferase